MAMFGGLAGAGAAAAAAAIAGGGGPTESIGNFEKLLLRISTEYARQKLDLPFDAMLWFQVTDFEGQIAATLNRLQPFSDAKSPMVVQLIEAQTAIRALLQFMIEMGLAPEALTDGEPGALQRLE
ncbi:hypothetical protein QGN32_23140 [Mycolicibacterium sp. ND9-15]|uniref:hypothetical protein n=1 Tax=Mycolicibacterium sp. ND9-15 TaxID=3042320 RepID=UPI002DDB1636|nr:hypothetical protein [Mycolicibacterium sp. ND9-15]WSE56193.1 hypothetical protein QGN32_23140 [Mycolicibacterium sp. ND9-15]